MKRWCPESSTLSLTSDTVGLVGHVLWFRFWRFLVKMTLHGDFGGQGGSKSAKNRWDAVKAHFTFCRALLHSPIFFPAPHPTPPWPSHFVAG